MPEVDDPAALSLTEPAVVPSLAEAVPEVPAEVVGVESVVVPVEVLPASSVAVVPVLSPQATSEVGTSENAARCIARP